MSRFQLASFSRALGLASAAALLLAAAPVWAQRNVEVEIRTAKPDGLAVEVDHAVAGKFWIGLQCGQPDATLRAQLNLEEGVGLVVHDVLQDSPAAGAGVKEHDVLVKAGDRPMKQIADLVAAVNEAKQTELAVELIRGGKQQTIRVTPTERPETMRVLPRAPGQSPEAAVRMFERLFREGAPGDRFDFRVLRPGAVWPGGIPAQPGAEPDVPADLSISIIKKGNEPAKVTVKRGDQTWETTSDKLSELPEDVRGHVQRYLGRNGVWPDGTPPGAPPRVFHFREGRFLPGRANDEIRTKTSPNQDQPADTAKQLKQLSTQLEALRKQVEQIQRSLPKE